MPYQEEAGKFHPLQKYGRRKQRVLVLPRACLMSCKSLFFFTFFGNLFLCLGHTLGGGEKMGHRKRPSNLDRKFVGGDRQDDRAEYLTQQEILPRCQLSLCPLQPVYYLYVRTRPAGSTFLWEAACARPPFLPYQKYYQKYYKIL